MGSTEHRGGDNDADAENDRSGNNCGSHVFVFENFPVEIPGSTLVEKFVTGDGRADADNRKQKHVTDRFAERLRVPGRNCRRLGRERRRRGQNDQREERARERSFHNG